MRVMWLIPENLQQMVPLFYERDDEFRISIHDQIREAQLVEGGRPKPVKLRDETEYVWKMFSHIIQAARSLNNEYSALKHVTCNNGFKLIIRQPVDVNGVILLAGAGPQNLADVEELERRTESLIVILKFLYGPAFDVHLNLISAATKEIAWSKVSLLLNKWAELAHSEHCYLVEALEELSVDDGARGQRQDPLSDQCNIIFSVAFETIKRKLGCKYHHIIHALLVVESKVLNLRASEKDRTLASYDTLLLMLFAMAYFPSHITPESLFSKNYQKDDTDSMYGLLTDNNDSSDVDHMGFSETDAYFQDAVSHILEDEEIGTTDTQSLFSMNSVATDDSRDSVNSGSAAPRAASSLKRGVEFSLYSIHDTIPETVDLTTNQPALSDLSTHQSLMDKTCSTTTSELENTPRLLLTEQEVFLTTDLPGELSTDPPCDTVKSETPGDTSAEQPDTLIPEQPETLTAGSPDVLTNQPAETVNDTESEAHTPNLSLRQSEPTPVVINSGAGHKTLERGNSSQEMPVASPNFGEIGGSEGTPINGMFQSSTPHPSPTPSATSTSSDASRRSTRSQSRGKPTRTMTPKFFRTASLPRSLPKGIMRPRTPLGRHERSRSTEDTSTLGVQEKENVLNTASYNPSRRFSTPGSEAEQTDDDYQSVGSPSIHHGRLRHQSTDSDMSYKTTHNQSDSTSTPLDTTYLLEKVLENTEPNRFHKDLFIHERVFLSSQMCPAVPACVYVISITPGICLVMAAEITDPNHASKLTDVISQLTHLLHPYSRNEQSYTYSLKIIDEMADRLKSIGALLTSRDKDNKLLQRYDALFQRWKDKVLVSLRTHIRRFQKHNIVVKNLNNILETSLQTMIKDVKYLFRMMYMPMADTAPDTPAHLEKLQRRTIHHLRFYKGILLVKALRNLPMTAFHNDKYPGLLHFIYVHRNLNRNTLMAPSLGLAEADDTLMTELMRDMKQKLWKIVPWFYKQLANGYTKISVKDGDFLFTFEMSVFDEVNFRFYPNVLHNTKLFHPTRQTIGEFTGSFYKRLFKENGIGNGMKCLELITVHFAIVPELMVYQQRDRLLLNDIYRRENTLH